MDPTKIPTMSGGKLKKSLAKKPEKSAYSKPKKEEISVGDDFGKNLLLGILGMHGIADFLEFAKNVTEQGGPQRAVDSSPQIRPEKKIRPEQAIKPC